MNINRLTKVVVIAVVLTLYSMSCSAQRLDFSFDKQPAKYGVYIADLQTKKIRYIGSLNEAWSISPDGKLIAGTYYNGDTSDLNIFDIKTGKKRFLKRYQPYGPAVYTDIRWSSDSRWLKVAYDWNTEDDNEKEKVDILPVEPQTKGKLVPKSIKGTAAYSDEAPGFKVEGYEVIEAKHSPDKKIVAATCRKGSYIEHGYRAGLFICRPDGTILVQVTRFIFNLSTDPMKYDHKTDAEDREIQWLPNGKGIVFRRTSHEDEGI